METDLSRYLRVVWRWRWLVVTATVLATIVSLVVVQALPRTYRASSFLMVGEDTANPAVRTDEQQVTQRALVSYMNMARREPVLDAAIRALGVGMDWRTLQDQVITRRVEGSTVFEIRVVDNAPQRVQALANEIARQLVLLSPTLANMQQTEDRRAFIQRQLDALQANIVQAEAELADRQAALGREVSARGVLERQDEIRAIEAKLSGWRASYATLLPATTQTRGPNSLTIVERATMPTEPVSPNVPMTVLLASLLGAIVGIAAAFVLEYLDDAMLGPDEVTQRLGLPVIGAVRTIDRYRRPAEGLVTFHTPLSPDAEAFRLARTTTEMVTGRTTPLVLLVTSPSLGEGKSFVSANLAVSFAQAGRRTVLVDGDLRHPSVHTFFGLDVQPGLSHLLATGAMESAAAASTSLSDTPALLTDELGRTVRPTVVPNLHLLTSGTVPPNPAELLGNGSLPRIIARLRDQADVVIIDSPPVLPVADTLILTTTGAHVLLVVQAGRTRRTAVRRTLDSLRRAQAEPVGIILNRAQIVRHEYHRYPYPVATATSSRSRPRLRLIGRG